MSFTDRESIVEVVNKLFVYTDAQEWSKLKTEVFANLVDFDMSSLGGETTTGKSSDEICSDWKSGFNGLDAVNHLAGNHLVTINANEADVFVYATATHFKESATKGKKREFVGSYNLHLTKNKESWKIDKFKYNLQYASGNLTME